MVKHDAPGVLPLAKCATVEDVLAGLRERGGRATAARRLLLAALFRDRQHRTAEELAEQVQAQSPDVNLSTIYRNLDELVRLGVVDRSHLGGGPAAYHLASATHGHLVCEQCGAMTEVPSELFRGITETLASRYGFDAAPHRFAVIGRCADCQRHDTGQLLAPRAPRTACTPRGIELCYPCLRPWPGVRRAGLPRQSAALAPGPRRRQAPRLI